MGIIVARPRRRYFEHERRGEPRHGLGEEFPVVAKYAANGRPRREIDLIRHLMYQRGGRRTRINRTRERRSTSQSRLVI